MLVGQENALWPSRSLRNGRSAFHSQHISPSYKNCSENQVQARLRYAREQRVVEVAEGRATRVEIVVHGVEFSVVEHIDFFELELQAEAFMKLEVFGKGGVHLGIAWQAYVSLTSISECCLGWDGECRGVDPVIETFAIQGLSDLVRPLRTVSLAGVRIHAQIDGNGLTSLDVDEA